MRFQTLKNRLNFASEHGGFSQRQSHILHKLFSVQLYEYFMLKLLQVSWNYKNCEIPLFFLTYMVYISLVKDQPYIKLEFVHTGKVFS